MESGLCFAIYCAVDDDGDEDEEAVGRLLRRCWLTGMPRCADR
jgi:hypothetical protein